MKRLKIFVLCCFILVLGACSINISNTYASPAQQEHITTSATLPASYDLRDYIDIQVENQGVYNICFSYASLTSVETLLAKKYNEYYDFSELHFALSLYLQDNEEISVKDALDNGGNFSQFDFYTQKDKSLVLEEDLPISKYDYMSDAKYALMEQDFNSVNNNFKPLVQVTETVSFPKIYGDKSDYDATELTSFRNSVKQHLMQHGSLTTAIHSKAGLSHNDKYFKVTGDQYLDDTSSAIYARLDHMVSIVGWDDNYNANGAWENKGAYLCLNSWGQSFGDGGYFYISYDDYFVEYSIQGVTDINFCTDDVKISQILDTQQDTFVSIHTVNEKSLDQLLYFANIIDVSQYINSKINYIDLYVQSPSTSIYINFYNNYDNALAGIASMASAYATYHKPASKIATGAIYDRFELASPLKITNNYIVVISRSTAPCKTFSLCTRTDSGVNIPTTYCSGDSNGYFNVNHVNCLWDPAISEDPATKMLPTVLHLQQNYLTVSQFSSPSPSYINLKYVKNNAIFYDKTLNLTFSSLTSINNIKVTKLGTTDDYTSNFEFGLNNNILSMKMIAPISSSFEEGNYLLEVPTSQGTIYRVFETQEACTYSITYHLNGGTAINPSVFSSNQSILVLNNPTKAGYNFVGWYTDSTFTTSFRPNNLPDNALELWAKYDFAKPTITSKSSNINTTYSNGASYTLSVTANHALASSSNPLSYQWHYRKTTSDEFAPIANATSSSLTIYNVNQSGYYACEVTININDPTLTATPCTRVLSASSINQISVNIKPFIYDMSLASWDYTEPLSYNTQTYTVTLKNLPQGVTATYTNNQASEIGTYTAHANLIYDNMNGNALISNIEDLTWTIRPSKITIKINDIVSENEIDLDTLSNMYSCDITHEYLPADVITNEQILEYLELNYTLQPTSQENIKMITATTKTFDIHEIIIINGEYRVVLYQFSSGELSTTSKLGFVKDCAFTSTKVQVNNEIVSTLKEKHLQILDSYNVSYSYLHKDDIVTMHIDLPKQQLFNELSVYVLKDGKLTKADNIKVNSNGISFTSTDVNATYILVENNLDHTNNVQYIVLLILGGGFLAGYIYIFLHKRHNKFDI